jgi:hypothetical protein
VNGNLLLGVNCADEGARKLTISVFHPKAIPPTLPARLLPFVISVPLQDNNSGDARGHSRSNGWIFSHHQVGRDRLPLPHLLEKERGTCVAALIAQVTRPIWAL